MALTRFHRVIKLTFGPIGSSHGTGIRMYDNRLTADHVCLNTTALSDFDVSWETGDGYARITTGGVTYTDKVFPGAVLYFAKPVETI